jgi:hypothetical protein
MRDDWLPMELLRFSIAVTVKAYGVTHSISGDKQHPAGQRTGIPTNQSHLESA